MSKGMRPDNPVPRYAPYDKSNADVRLPPATLGSKSAKSDDAGAASFPPAPSSAAARAAEHPLPPPPSLPLLGEAPAAFPLLAATTIGLPHTDVCKFSFSTSSTSSAPSGAAFDRFLAGTCASPRPPPPAAAASPVLT